MNTGHAADCLRRAWEFLRRLCGDDAYERYRDHQALRHPDAPLMSRREFCADENRRKWSGVSRCC